MSTKEDQPLGENEKSTLEEESKSEESSVEVVENGDETPVTRAEMNEYLEKQANLEKGIKKMATEKGRESNNSTNANATENVAPQENVIPQENVASQSKSSSDVNTILFQNQRPETRDSDVWKEITKRAEQAGEDPIIFYNNDPMLQEYAQKKHDEKVQESENKNKLDAPSSFQGQQGKVNLDKIEAKDVNKLQISDQQKWVNQQIENERRGRNAEN